MKPSEVDVEEGWVLLDEFKKVFLGELILLLIQVVASEEEVGILFGETCHVGLNLWVLPILFKALDGKDAAFTHSLLLPIVTTFLDEGIRVILVERFRFFVGGLHSTEDFTGRDVILSLLPFVIFLFFFGFLVNDVLFLDFLVFWTKVIGKLVLPDIL